MVVSLVHRTMYMDQICHHIAAEMVLYMPKYDQNSPVHVLPEQVLSTGACTIPARAWYVVWDVPTIALIPNTSIPGAWLCSIGA